jgi:hypothetical protein
VAAIAIVMILQLLEEELDGGHRRRYYYREEEEGLVELNLSFRLRMMVDVAVY